VNGFVICLVADGHSPSRPKRATRRSALLTEFDRVKSFVTCAALAALLGASSSSARSAVRESFDMNVPAPPSPVTIEGREWLIYELHLTNFSREPLRLLNLDVLTETRELQSFSGDELARRVAPAVLPRADAQPVQPGERAVVYLEVPMSGASSDRLLQHRLRYSPDGSPQAAEVVGAEVGVLAKPRLALGPPLRGGPWAAVYAWEWPRGHRRVFYAVDGRARLPGRFAIDWVSREETSDPADTDLVKTLPGYGADVLAVANARVAAVRDGIAESERRSDNPRHSLEEAAGNYVSLDLGDGRFAVYEHLARGSIRVVAGDRVKRGQVIASLGFSGDSSEPHLHFHVADSPSPLSGEGLPYEFELGGKRERPASNATITFH
jgi:murein DD-endopeptidase